MIDQSSSIDLKELFDALKAKRDRYNMLYDYYRGYHPLKYSASRLKKAFEKLDSYFAMNWIAVIIDSVLDRLVLKGFDVTESDDANNILDELWRTYNLHLVSDDVHESAIVTGEGFIIAQESAEEDAEQPLDIYFNDPRMCHIFYEYERPQKKRYAGKMWVGQDKFARITLYYPDRFEHYVSNTQIKKNQMIQSWTAFEPDPEVPVEANVFGEIPVFHFTIGKISKKRDIGPSEISLQDAINKLLTDMLVSSEFNSFVQRVIISQADPGNLQNIPGANWWIPAGDGKSQQAQVIELGGRSLDTYLGAIDKLATALAIISRTPKHYFFLQGGDPSGEALITMESPLTKKVKKRQEHFSVEWQAFAKFLLRLARGPENIKRTQISPLWEPVETVLPQAEATVIKTETEAGIPLVTAVRRRGWAEDEIMQMEEDKKVAQKEMSGLAQAALEKLRAEDAQSNFSGNGANNEQKRD